MQTTFAAEPGSGFQRIARAIRRVGVTGCCLAACLAWGLSGPTSLLAAEPTPPATTAPAASSSKASKTKGSTVTPIGSRRELFVDDTLIDNLSGQARLELHHPQRQEIVIVHDAPWEGSGSGYHSLFQDGDRYRMYYKSWQIDVQPGQKVKTTSHPGYCCYAESKDGIHWEKPELGLFDYQGSKANNIVMATGTIEGLKVDAAHPAVFKDENPAAPPEARYKALFRSNGEHGLLAFQSADGLRWSPMSRTPVITEGAFDSQNLAFWDPALGQYRAYWRYFTAGVANGKEWKPSGSRAIRTATSPDFIHWSTPADLQYVDSPVEQLYTNQVKPYLRAPHLLLGFPMRYFDRGWSDSMSALPELENRKTRSETNPRYGTAITETLLMASRDGTLFKRWNEAFLPPGIERPGTWNYGHQCLAWQVVETKSSLAGAPNELSLYGVENYWTGNSSELRRYTIRMDGFVSVTAPRTGGELVTRPVTFTGDELRLNFSTSAVGSVRVELQDAAGKPIPGFTLADSLETFGNALDRRVGWKSGTSVRSLQGQPVRLRFVLNDADVYAYRFQPAK